MRSAGQSKATIPSEDGRTFKKSISERIFSLFISVLFFRKEQPFCGMFLANLVLKCHEGVQQGFRAHRTTAHIDIYRYDFINSLQHRICAEHSAGRRASAHCHNPFRSRHLIVNSAYRARHLISYSSGNNHAIALAGGKAHDFHAT